LVPLLPILHDKHGLRANRIAATLLFDRETRRVEENDERSATLSPYHVPIPAMLKEVPRPSEQCEAERNR
jgi:hypothetical protein